MLHFNFLCARFENVKQATRNIRQPIVSIKEKEKEIEVVLSYFEFQDRRVSACVTLTTVICNLP